MPTLNELSHIKPPPLSPDAQYEEPKQEPNDTLHIKVPSPTLPSKPQSAQESEIQPADVEVKAELIDHSSELLQDTVQHGEAVFSTKATPHPSDTAMEHTFPSNASDLKIDVTHLGTELTRSASANPKSASSRKRAAPRSRVEKKGTASTVKPAKRRKVEAVSVDGTPSVQRSVTPASSRASKTPAPRNRKQESVTPVRSSSVAAPNDEDEEDDEDSELFCICRKPDDHTWMIACDGGCEDWFHGRCVNMNERDGNLIDKYICAYSIAFFLGTATNPSGPNCKTEGVGQTTWKPMCRLESCRNPARVSGSKPSKYCSDEHGQEFMKIHALKQEPEEVKGTVSSNRKRRRDNYTDHYGNGEVEDGLDTTDSTALRGGILRAAELRSIASGVKDIHEFRQLGEGVLSPPRTASPDDDAHNGFSYSVTESQQLSDIATKRQALKDRKGMLDDRERFIGLVKGRAKRVLEDLRKKESVKDICGYDSRLSWSDDEFLAWRNSPEGQKALESEILAAPPPLTSTPVILAESTSDPADANDPTAEVSNHVPDAADAGDAAENVDVDMDEDEIGRGMCQKRHCQRHRAWYKLQQQDVAFEKGELRLALGRLAVEEKGVRERAVVRSLEEG